MKIRVLYLKECPNAGPALNLLRQGLHAKNVKEEIEVIEIRNEEEAKKHKFLGSPTIQINGRDIEQEKRAAPTFFGCRIYESGNGYSGVPPKEMIINAIEEAIHRSTRSVKS